MADQSLPSFSLALPGGKKPPAKQQIQISDRADEKKRELIAGIGSGGIESLEQTVEAGPRVIPKQQNTFVVGTFTAPLFPLQNGGPDRTAYIQTQ